MPSTEVQPHNIIGNGNVEAETQLLEHIWNVSVRID